MTVTIGVDIGGTNVRAGAVTEDGTLVDLVTALTPSDAVALEDAIAAVIAELTTRHHVSAIGLAIAGFLTADRHIVRFAPHLAWRDVSVAERLSRRLGLPVCMEHDTNAAAFAEYHMGAARGAKVAVLIALGTGVGVGLLVDGILFRGAFGVAPELGHICLVPGGRLCPCGKRGCWERYCSGSALSLTAKDLLAEKASSSTTLAAVDPVAFTGKIVAQAARQGDFVARIAVAELARWLGQGMTMVADLYDPEVIVIGGGVSGSADLFLDAAVQHYLMTITGAEHRDLAAVRVAQLGDKAGIIGAGLLARNQ